MLDTINGEDKQEQFEKVIQWILIYQRTSLGFKASLLILNI